MVVIWVAILVLSGYLGVMLALNHAVGRLIFASDSPGRTALIWAGVVFVPLDAVPFFVLATLRPVNWVGVAVGLVVLLFARITLYWPWEERTAVWASRIGQGAAFYFLIFVRFALVIREAEGLG